MPKQGKFSGEQGTPRRITANEGFASCKSALNFDPFRRDELKSRPDGIFGKDSALILDFAVGFLAVPTHVLRLASDFLDLKSIANSPSRTKRFVLLY